MKNKGVTRIRAKNIHEKNNYICFYCLRECTPIDEERTDRSATIDHVIPFSIVKENKVPNLVTACYICNFKKDNMSLKGWCDKNNVSYIDMQWRLVIYCIYHIILKDIEQRLFFRLYRKIYL